MTEYEQIARLREAARARLTELDDTPPPTEQSGQSPEQSPAAHRQLETLREEIRTRAADLIEAAGRPVAIATIGGFSNGKSALVGCLLGAADLLPTSENPTTGNVTVLRLVPAGADGRTRITTAVVEFMTVDDVDECLAFMLGELIDLIERTEGTDSPLAPGRLRDYRPRTDGWERFDDWARTRLWPRGGPDTTARQMAVELTQLRDALAEVPAQVVGSHITPWPTAPDVITDGLTLPPTTAVPVSYPERRRRPRPQSWPAQLGSPQLRAAFPLIRRIVCTVEVNPDAWPLNALGGLPMEIRDFPGLGADGSGNRDLHISRRELEGADAILATLSASKPVTRPLAVYYAQLRRLGYTDDMLERATVVAANRFDRVGAPADPPADTLDELREQAPLLNEVLVAAEHLTARRLADGQAPDRLVLVSALSALAAVGRAPAGTDPRSAAAEAERWGQAGTALADGDERPGPARVADLLSEYGYDRGLGELRRVVNEHARVHGVANKVARLRQAAAALDLAARRHAELLAWHRERQEPTPARDARDLAEVLDELRTGVSGLRRGLAGFRSPHRLVVERAEGPVALLRAIEADARRAVDAWPVWATLTDALDDQQPWVHPVGEDRQEDPEGIFPLFPIDGPDDDPDDVPGAPEAAPNHGSVLVAQFERTAGELVERSRGYLLDVVGDWEDDQRELFVVPGARLADDRLRPLAGRVLGPRRMRLLGALTGDLQMRVVAKNLLASVARADGDGALVAMAADAASAAPFDGAQPLPWHPDVVRIDERIDAGRSQRERHVFAINLIRIAAQTSLTEYVQNDVVTTLAQVARTLDQWIGRLAEGVPTPRQLAELLHVEDGGL
ncbi:dynamin family protein [Frankia sp. AgB32]|uniref:dynamin family protein n=1 Tax=Frankia sp. AgB32 TaxID=631119 RepID=UPI00200BC861|nr:dynamin family protein [Frankia sp. AgB32]MCK9893666.1 dynamin family protein [Frankia sp. AgB32]